MLSYQHSYHAGNHADVLKHLVLVSVLNKLNKKNKAYFLLDTHAGNGAYSLHAEKAQQRRPEHLDGVSRLLQVVAGKPLPPDLQAYVDLVAPMVAANNYPGSPRLSATLMRAQDSLHCAELHPNVFADLRQNLNAKHVHLHQANGFAQLNALLPPQPKRGALLIDPPYEQTQEYQATLDAVKLALKKWPTGCVMLWYPLLSDEYIDRESHQVVVNAKAKVNQQSIQQIRQIPCSGLLDIQFCAQSPTPQVGMYGSGMLIFNPPWQLYESLSACLPILQDTLQQEDHQLSKLQWIVEPA